MTKRRDKPEPMTAEQEALLKEANHRFFQRECERASIDPTKGVSPSLLKLIESYA